MGKARHIACLILAVSVQAFHGEHTQVLGQAPNSKVEQASAKTQNCRCGHWTCQACQRRQLCPPLSVTPRTASPSIAPGSESTDARPDAIDVESSLTAPGADAMAALAPPAAADLFASNQSAGSSAFGSSLLNATTPEMMGDYFGPVPVPSIFVFDQGETVYSLPIPSAGYNLGRIKQGENSSPIPRDRVFFNYSLFDGVPLTTNGSTVNRFTPGFEKTFLDGLASFELKMPLGTSLDTSINVSGLNSDSRFQVGNMLATVKGVLIESQNHVFTGGLSLLIPTASDVKVLEPSGNEFLRITNESTHIMPFVGGAYLTGNRFFSQWMLQVDVDSNGNSVIVNPNQQNAREIGTLQDFTMLYADLSVGYWVHRATCGKWAGCGMAALAELHYNRSLNSLDGVSDNANFVFQTLPEIDNLNTTLGIIFQLRNQTRLAFGYAAPLGNGTDRLFDNELRITLNRYF